MSQQNQITEVHWQCVRGDHKPCRAYCWVHATGKGLSDSRGDNCVGGYPHVPVLPGQQHPFQFPQNSIETQLCSSPYYFTYSPPSLLAPPSPEIFCLLCSCPGYPQQRGRARWVLATTGLISIPLSECNLSVKKLTFPSHALSAFIFSSHFSGKFFVLVWFWIAFLFLIFTLADISVFNHLQWTFFFFPEYTQGLNHYTSIIFRTSISIVQYEKSMMGSALFKTDQRWAKKRKALQYWVSSLGIFHDLTGNIILDPSSKILHNVFLMQMFILQSSVSCKNPFLAPRWL